MAKKERGLISLVGPCFLLDTVLSQNKTTVFKIWRMIAIKCTGVNWAVVSLNGWRFVILKSISEGGDIKNESIDVARGIEELIFFMHQFANLTNLFIG